MRGRDRDRYRQEREVFDAMRPTRRIAASDHFRERVMRAIREEEEKAAAPRGRRNLRWVWVAAAAAALLLLIPMLPRGNKSPSVALLAESLQAMEGVKTVHMTGRMRTVAGDNFELIGKDYDFVPLEIWREYSNPPRWRLEKPGRVVVMDGQSQLLYMSKSNTAAKGGPPARFVQWLQPLLDPQSLLETEMAAARRGGSVMETQGVTALTVLRSAQGNFVNDWMRNQSITESITGACTASTRPPTGSRECR